MKIIFTTDTIHRGGKERQIFILTQQLLKRTYDIFIISFKYVEQNYLDEYEIDSKRIIILKSNSGKQLYRELKNVLSTLHPDIVLSWDSKTALFSLIISKKYGFEFINASIRHGIGLFKKGYFIRTLICHLSPNVMANSLAGLKANKLRPRKKRFVLYNGIENKFSFTYLVEEKKAKCKELLGKEFNGIKIFVSVGNLVPFKDYFTVLKALKEYKKKKEFHYIIIGEGPLRIEYEKLIEEYGLRKNVYDVFLLLPLLS
ncbi:glycosyltransferase [Candidatus Atribacteria bacterium 1244-E10-H5-B2]|nr:MAG: glycosyltransferase [Candidatus Atribacteria bacterium 1244-E10-H5-B2]